MRLQDKVALVTGSGQGIGRGIAVRLAREGAGVVIVDLQDDADSRKTLALVEEAGATAGCWRPTSATSPRSARWSMRR